MTESRDNLSSCKCVLSELGDILYGGVVAQLLLGGFQPSQAFLVREAVKRTCEAVDTSRECKIRICKGASNQVGCVSGDVASLVISVQHQVHACDILELIFAADAEHMSIVASPIQ